MTDKMMRGFAQRDLARKLGERNTRSSVGSRSRQRKARSVVCVADEPSMADRAPPARYGAI